MFEEILISLVGIFLTICLLIGIHEFGHFLAAKCLGIKVLCFSIGFGKKLFKWYDKTGTEYSISIFPLGGYVKLLDEFEIKVPEKDKHLTFNRQSITKRAIVICAGPLFNLIFAFLAYWIVLVIGINTSIPIIGEISKSSIAFNAGLKPKQEIIKINDTKINDWIDIITAIFPKIGTSGTLNITVKEKNLKQTYILTLENFELDDLTPDPIQSLGIIPSEHKAPAIIDKFLKNSPAKKSLKLQDKILAINDEKIEDWEALIKTIKKYPSQTVLITIERDNKIIKIPVKTAYKRNLLFQKEGMLGIETTWKIPKEFIKENKYSSMKALKYSYHKVVQFIYLNILVLWKLITGKISIGSIAGPISILTSAGVALNLGLVMFLSFLSFISASLFLVNILPIPGLDGGYLLYLFIESITKRPISMGVQILLYKLGIIFIVVIILQGLANDILRLL